MKTFQFAMNWCIHRIRGFTTMRYINRHFTHLLTYLLTYSCAVEERSVSCVAWRRSGRLRLQLRLLSAHVAMKRCGVTLTYDWLLLFSRSLLSLAGPACHERTSFDSLCLSASLPLSVCPSVSGTTCLETSHKLRYYTTVKLNCCR